MILNTHAILAKRKEKLVKFLKNKLFNKLMIQEKSSNPEQARAINKKIHERGALSVSTSRLVKKTRTQVFTQKEANCVKISNLCIT